MDINPMATKRTGAAAVAVPELGAVYVFGGQIQPDPPARGASPAFLSTVEKLEGTQREPATWRWSTLRSTMHWPRSNAAAVYHNGTIYVVGGRMCRPRDSCLLSSVESFGVLKENHKAVLPPMSVPRYRPKAAVFQATLYVVGGRGELDFLYLASGEALDLETMRWTVLPELIPHNRAVLAVFPYTKALMILAGNASMPNATHAEITNCSAAGPRSGLHTVQRPCRVVELPDAVPQYGNPGVVLRGSTALVYGGLLCPTSVYLERGPLQRNECLPARGDLSVDLISLRVRRGDPPGSFPGDLADVCIAATVDLGDGILVLGGQRVVDQARVSTDAVTLYGTRRPHSTSTTTSTHAPRRRHRSHAAAVSLASVTAAGAALIIFILGTRQTAAAGSTDDDDDELIEMEPQRVRHLVPRDILDEVEPLQPPSPQRVRYLVPRDILDEVEPLQPPSPQRVRYLVPRDILDEQ